MSSSTTYLKHQNFPKANLSQQLQVKFTIVKTKLIADLGAERRVNAQSSDIPIELVNAIVSIEDHRFFNHRGIDSIRIAGAFLRNLSSRGGLQGGSTLTQQLIKLTYFQLLRQTKLSLVRLRKLG